MKKSAFTMIELMIVVSIIAFLATISIPRYFNYYAKAKQAEVAVNLASLHTAQEAYFAEHGEYCAQLSGPNGIGWQPQGYKGGGEQENFYYTYGFNTQGAQEGVHYFTGKLKTPKDKLGKTFVNKNKFTAGAAGTVNEKIDTWQIDQDRNLKNTLKGI